ncbi:polyketide synthase dehydratase domain-containing protein [Catellatospora coxensis]
MLAGRLSPATQPWLNDHAVMGAVLLPGTAFVELALRAAREAGCPRIEELTLVAPLALPSSGGVRVQVTVSERDDKGRRTVEIHSRPDGDPDAAWSQHAAGVLTETPAVPEAAGAAWPPPEVTELDVSGVYDDLAGQGYRYGPAFQGMRRVWQRDRELYVEVELPEAQRAAAARCMVHPALLDAALHALLPGVTAESTTPGLPFSWNGVTLHRPGVTALRGRLTRHRAEAGLDTVRLELTDEYGTPVVSVESMLSRPFPAEALAATPHDALYRVDWTEAPRRRPWRTGRCSATPSSRRHSRARATADCPNWPTPARRCPRTCSCPWRRTRRQTSPSRPARPPTRCSTWPSAGCANPVSPTPAWSC